MKEHAETKQEHMEMRKAIGNRVITPPKATPFHRGPDYLSHYACFVCCKSFKQDAMSSSHRHICPECSGDLHDMGRNFRPPRKAAKASWEVARRLYVAGFRFFGSGSHSDPALPTSLRELDQFIADNPNHYLRIR